MNSFRKWFQDHLGLTRMVLLLFVGLNLFSAYRIFCESPVLVLAHVIMAVVLLLAAIFVH